MRQSLSIRPLPLMVVSSAHKSQQTTPTNSSTQKTQLKIIQSTEQLKKKQGTLAMKRIPRLKFPQRHLKSSSSSGGESQAKVASGGMSSGKLSTSKSDVPAAPSTLGGGGKASLQPKRTPLSDKEIEAILLGGCD